MAGTPQAGAQRGIKPLPSLDDVDVAGRTVFLRLDLNVPLKAGAVQSDARIVAALPTLRRLLDAGARLAVASHLGRPDGRFDAAFSMEPVGQKLSALLNQQVLLSQARHGDGVRGLLRELRHKDFILLENLRFDAGEEKNDPALAAALAAPFDVYVNDAFGASHRAHASIVGMVRHIREVAAGPLMARECHELGRLLARPRSPFVAVVGGAKVSDKLGVLEALLGHVDALMVGGAMAYTFLRAAGHDVGKSRCEDDKLRVAGAVLKRARDRGIPLLLPVDHVAAPAFDEDAAAVAVDGAALPSGLMGLDIGPKTRALFAERIRRAATVFWNGPMGVFEWPTFAAGTYHVARAVAESEAHSVVGGGDSVAAVEAAGVADQISHISTGGGASLELLQYSTLPGLDALRR